MIGRSHLREVSNRWQGSVVDGKTDISPEDAKCIDILIDHLANSEDFELAALLSKWKKIPDSNFIEELKSFTNSGNYDGEYIEEGESEKKTNILDDLFTPTMIEVGELTFDVSKIEVIRVGSGYSEIKERNVHFIEINPKEFSSRKPTFKREFVKEEQRDKELEMLRVKLKKEGVKFI